MAKKRVRGRPVDGILLLDKPLGISSNNALQQVKGIYFAQKAGHTGSLDPLATGMLPLCFGEATKFSQFFLDADKKYQVIAQLGVTTTTADAEGEVLQEKDASAIGLSNIEQVLPKFRGDIKQIPSMFSALKHEGQPLYKLALQGIEVERKARPISIYDLTILDFNAENKTLSLNVKCSKGTYIRNLVEDIGEALELLRDEKAFHELDDLLLPLAHVAASLPKITLTAAATYAIFQGQEITHNLQQIGLVSLFNNDNNFIGIGEIISPEILKAKRLVKDPN
jgi:tRNA pseudouridine55 synthase